MGFQDRCRHKTPHFPDTHQRVGTESETYPKPRLLIKLIIFLHRWKSLFLSGLAFLAGGGIVHAQLNKATSPAASYALIRRILPDKATSFIIESLPVAAGKDSFELESRGSRIVLRGNNGVAGGSALSYYITESCTCQVTWN